MTTSALTHSFALETSHSAPDVNLPQKLGTRLWKPMLLMALMAFPLALIVGFIRSATIADGSDEVAVAALSHFGAGFDSNANPGTLKCIEAKCAEADPSSVRKDPAGPGCVDSRSGP